MYLNRSKRPLQTTSSPVRTKSSSFETKHYLPTAYRQSKRAVVLTPPFARTFLLTWEHWKLFRLSLIANCCLWKAGATTSRPTTPESSLIISSMSLTFRCDMKPLLKMLLVHTVGQGGDKIPRKGGPGVSQSDVLVINKVSLVVAILPLYMRIIMILLCRRISHLMLERRLKSWIETLGSCVEMGQRFLHL